MDHLNLIWNKNDDERDAKKDLSRNKTLTAKIRQNEKIEREYNYMAWYGMV